MKYREDTILSALAAAHPAPAWAFLTQVRSGTGFVRNLRTADAVAMSLWPSRGIELHGFEVKISNGDLKRELADPAKADEVARFCDRWWIAAPKGLVSVTDLPGAWGLIEVDDQSRVRRVKEPPRLEPRPPSPAFLAALLRRVHETQPGEEEISRRVREARDKDEQANRAEKDRLKQELEEARAQNVKTQHRDEIVSRLEQILGEPLSRYLVAEYAEAIRAARCVKPHQLLRAAEDLAARAAAAADALRPVLSAEIR